MAQRRKGERVLGPYSHGKQWRVVVVGAGGERDSRFYPTEEQAKAIARAVRKEFNRGSQKTVQEAFDAYEAYLSRDKQNKRVSVKNTMYRLESFFSDRDMLLDDLTAPTCERYYEELRRRPTRTRKEFSVDSHQTILAAAKTFLRWCIGKPRRWMSRSPIEEVQGVGKRRHGKPQLRIDEARRWVAKATEVAERGEAGAVAALVSLLMGMRASEITTRIVRDLDDDGRLLWIPDAKTEAGKRTLQVPDVLRPYLRALASGTKWDDHLFGEHWRDWVRKWVRRICDEAKVPRVTAHGMRGLHSTLALEHGASAHVVASSLGHESFSTTVESYARPEALARMPNSGASSPCSREGRGASSPHLLTGNDWTSNRSQATFKKIKLSNLVELNGIEPSASLNAISDLTEQNQAVKRLNRSRDRRNVSKSHGFPGERLGRRPPHGAGRMIEVTGSLGRARQQHLIDLV